MRKLVIAFSRCKAGHSVRAAHFTPYYHCLYVKEITVSWAFLPLISVHFSNFSIFRRQRLKTI